MNNVERIDSDRLRKLIDAHGAALVLYARQWCNAPDDALQEGLVDLIRRKPVPRNPVAWLFKTVRRKAMNLARGEQRRKQYQRRAGEQSEAHFVESGPEGFTSDELEGLLEGLPALEREIVVARIWGELSFEQISALTRKPSSTVHRYYRRALALLRLKLNNTPNLLEHSNEPRI